MTVEKCVFGEDILSWTGRFKREVSAIMDVCVEHGIIRIVEYI